MRITFSFNETKYPALAGYLAQLEGGERSRWIAGALERAAASSENDALSRACEAELNRLLNIALAQIDHLQRGMETVIGLAQGNVLQWTAYDNGTGRHEDSGAQELALPPEFVQQFSPGAGNGKR